MTDKSHTPALESEPEGMSNSPAVPFYTPFSQSSLLAIISTIFYMICYIYYISFSRRLALPYQGIDLPITLIIGDILFIISIFLILLIIIKIVVKYRTKVSENIFLFLNILLFFWYSITIKYLFYSIYDLFSKTEEGVIDDSMAAKEFNNFLSGNSGLFLLLVGIAIIIIYIRFIASDTSWWKNLNSYIKQIQVNYKKFLTIVLEKIKIFSIYSFIGLVLAILMAASFAGNYNAEQLIEGKKSNVEIELTLEENITLPNNPLILLMIRDNNYYLVEKKDPAPENINILIIPSNKIKFAKTVLND